jgi:uncharacterized protein with GYD domain
MERTSENVSSLIDSLCSMICTVEETRKRLNAAKAMLSNAGIQNEKINSILEHCTADMKLSEKLVQHVQTNVEIMLQTQAA